VKRLIVIVLFSVLLCGCFTDGVVPSLGIGDKQDVSGGGSGNQGVGEAKLDIGSTNRDRYERSNVKQEQTSTESSTNNDVGTGAKSLIGADDYSINNTKSTSQTKNATDDDNYNASVINFAETMSHKVFNAIEKNFNALMMIFAFILGGYISGRRRDKYEISYNKLLIKDAVNSKDKDEVSNLKKTSIKDCVIIYVITTFAGFIFIVSLFLMVKLGLLNVK